MHIKHDILKYVSKNANPYGFPLCHDAVYMLQFNFIWKKCTIIQAGYSSCYKSKKNLESTLVL